MRRNVVIHILMRHAGLGGSRGGREEAISRAVLTQLLVTASSSSLFRSYHAHKPQMSVPSGQNSAVQLPRVRSSLLCKYVKGDRLAKYHSFCTWMHHLSIHLFVHHKISFQNPSLWEWGRVTDHPASLIASHLLVLSPNVPISGKALSA